MTRPLPAPVTRRGGQARIHLPFTRAAQADAMSMAEPFMPHPEQPDTAVDPDRDAPVPEDHGEPAEAEQQLTSAGEAARDRAVDGDGPR